MLYRDEAPGKLGTPGRHDTCTLTSLALGAGSAVSLLVIPFFLLPMIIGLVPFLLALSTALGVLAGGFSLGAAWRAEPKRALAWLGVLPGAVAATLLAGFLLSGAVLSGTL